jgi:F-box protein, helicase, 18
MYYESFNQEQQQVIKSTSRRIIINASAGTGKTLTLIGIANENAFVKTALITFTNKAADEMKARLKHKPFYVGTIHGFAMKELYNLAAKLGFRVRILKEPSIRKIIAKIYDENDFGVYVSNHLLNETYSFIADPSLEFDRRKMKLFNEVRRLYHKYKEQNQLYDPTDTPKYLLKKLRDHNLTLDYHLVLVDEAQDLDPIQYDLVQLLGKRIVAIGDPKQSIYMFRGATPDIFARFAADGYEEHTLKINYRSKQEIIDNAGIELECIRGVGGSILRTDIFHFGPMVLCRTNEEVDRIKKLYPSAMTIHAAKGLEFNNVCVVDFAVETEEDQNIMFVALTRAKDRIAVLKLAEVINQLYQS